MACPVAGFESLRTVRRWAHSHPLRRGRVRPTPGEEGALDHVFFFCELMKVRVGHISFLATSSGYTGSCAPYKMSIRSGGRLVWIGAQLS